MTTPAEVGVVDVLERIVEHIHLTSEHRVDAKRPPLHSCPIDPCATFRRFLIGRLP